MSNAEADFPAEEAFAPFAAPTDSDRRWNVCTGLIVSAVTFAHLRFVLLDTRLPRDLGLYHQDIIAASHAWEQLDVSELAGLLASSTGWLNVLHGLLQAIAGPSPVLASATCAFWVSGLVLATSWTARRAAGALAGCVAAALVAAMPMVFHTGRELWIHLPEATLVMTITGLWFTDRELAHRRTVAGIAVLGALLVSLRASGLPWAIGLFVLMAASAELRANLRPRRWTRLGVVLLIWIIAGSVQATDFWSYVSAKLNARAGYAQRLNDPVGQVLENLGILPPLMALAGAALSVVGRRRRIGVPHLLGLGLVSGSLALWGASRAGLDNFTLLAPGLALLGALGFARDRWVGGILALEVFMLAWAPQLLPLELIRPLAHVPPYGLYASKPQFGNRYRPWTGPEATSTRAVLQAVCPTTGTCIVAVNEGLYTPFGEEPGSLELHLAGHESIELLDLRHGWPPAGRHRQEGVPHALVSWSCKYRNSDWNRRFPRAAAGQQSITERFALETVWQARVGKRCQMTWSTPDGVVQNRDHLPAGPSSPSAGTKP